MKLIDKYNFQLLAICLLLFFSSCMNEKAIPDYNAYPDDIGKIVFTKCAVSGCHNEASKDAAGGLSLESWDKLFEGGRNSVSVIPYRSDYSTFMYYINTYADLGVTLTPTMPYNREKLTREEVLLVRDWINNGAPNRDGFVKFSDKANRKKFYVTNQGCDVVTVFDQETLLPMRYVDVGNSAGVESPHNIKVSADGQYWYVVSTGGNSLQKFRTSDDSYVGEAILGLKNWNTMALTPDGQKAFVIDWSFNGDIAEVNLNTLSVIHNLGFNNPHGSALNNTADTLYVTLQNSSEILKLPLIDFSAYEVVNLYTTPPPVSLLPHELVFSPDGTKYFVTCQGTTELRIFSTSTNQLLATIPVGGLPSEMVVSTSSNYLFVTCPEDTVNFPGKRGSVTVIDYTTNSFVKNIYTGHQPHGIGMDDAKRMVYVANRNASSDGPAPHHLGTCSGRNGNVSFIDLNTLETVKTETGSIKKIEVSVDPYAIGVRY